MKQLLNRYLVSAMPIIAGVMLMTSCSSNGSYDKADFVSANDAVVITGNFLDVVKNAGCDYTAAKGFALSDNAEKLLTSAMGRSDFNEMTSMKGVDLDNILVTSNMDNETMMIMLSVSDQAAFRKWLEDEIDLDEPEREDGYYIYQDSKYSSFLLKDNAAWVIRSSKGRTAIERLDAIREEAAENPIKSWQRALIDKKCTVGALVDMNMVMKEANLNVASLSGMDLENASLWCEANLKGLKLECNICLLDENGKTLKADIKYPKLDTNLLKYASKADQMVLMCSVPGDYDWDGALKSLMSTPFYHALGDYKDLLPIAFENLKMVDGTIMLSAGINGLNFNSLSAYNGVLAVQMKEGEAERIANMLNSLSSQISDWESGYSNWSVTSEGNTLVTSLGAINTDGGCTIKPAEFKGAVSELVIDFPKSHPLLSMISLPFGAKLTAKSDDNGEGSIVIEMTDAQGLLLENVIDFAGKFAR